MLTVNGKQFGQFFAFIIACLLSAASWSEQFAKVVMVEGNAWVTPNGAGERTALVEGLSIAAGDLIATGSNGKVALLLSDESIVRLNQGSEFQLNAVAPVAGWLPTAAGKLKSSYELLKGELWFRNKRRQSDIEISTAHVSISVRGTEFAVLADADQVLVTMLEGKITAANALGSVDASSGEQVITERGQPPRKRILLNPDDAVQWTIRVPESLSNPALFADTNNTDSPLSRAWQDFNAGNISSANQALKTITQNNPDDARSWQLYALTALITNDNSTALQASEQAISLDPSLLDARLIKSYALQSQFKLQAAARTVQAAVDLNPQYSAGWLQLAKLAAADGDYQQARRYAVKAADVAEQANQDIEATLGFIALNMGDRIAAENYFNQALSISPSFADAHLGLALAAMRAGDSKTALESIATTVAIEPSEANYLNYFAKILYHQGRYQRALEVLERARELDPNDPTPVYLLAIIERDIGSERRSIALLQEAEVLNDKRGVYRSQQLLDADLAVKNVDLTLAFDSFNFKAWAQRRAVNAIELDPGSYSAHLMYANTLNEQAGRDTAFASAVLLSRILQPATANTFNSPNDYTTLFETPDIGGTLSLNAGSFSAQQAELVLYAADPDSRTAFQTDISHASSDGWRGTEDEVIQNLNTILKWDPSYNSGWTLGFVKQQIKQSDRIAGRFEFDAQSQPRDSRDIDLRSIELAYRYAFTPSTQLITQYGYLEQDLASTTIDTFTTNTLLGPNIFEQRLDSDTQQRFQQLQLQLIASGETHSFIAGSINYFGKVAQVTENTSQLLVGFFPPPPVEALDADDETRTQFHSNYGLYQWRPSQRFSIDAGVYLDYFQDSDPVFGQNWDEFEINPRLGLVFNPSENNTFRLAAYRYLFSLLPGRIDPVELAGLTLFRGNQSGTVVEKANIAFEREWSNGYLQLLGYYGEDENEGREAFSNTVIVPQPGGAPPIQIITVNGVPQFFDSRRHGVDFIYNQLLSNELGLSINYNRLNIYSDNTKPAFDTVTRSALNREDEIAGITLSLVLANGLVFELENVYRHIRFDNSRADEEFALSNASIEWEFPDKRGQIRLEANNIGNTHFNWVTDSFVLDGRIPERQLMATIDINF